MSLAFELEQFDQTLNGARSSARLEDARSAMEVWLIDKFSIRTRDHLKGSPVSRIAFPKGAYSPAITEDSPADEAAFKNERSEPGKIEAEPGIEGSSENPKQRIPHDWVPNLTRKQKLGAIGIAATSGGLFYYLDIGSKIFKHYYEVLSIIFKIVKFFVLPF